jgi:hypothetical protein
MGRARIDMKLRRLAGVLQRGLHFVHLLDLDAGVVRAVESEDRFFDFSRQLDRVLRGDIVSVDQAAVESDACFQIRIVRRVMPYVTSAAAKSDDAETTAITALCLCPGHRGVEIGVKFCVGFAVDDREQLVDVFNFGQVGAVRLVAKIIIERDGESAEMTNPAGDILDPLVQAENFHADENDRRLLFVGRSRVIHRHIAASNRDVGHARIESVGIGLDGVGAHRTGGKRVARGSRGRTRHEAAPRQWRHDF